MRELESMAIKAVHNTLDQNKKADPTESESAVCSLLFLKQQGLPKGRATQNQNRLMYDLFPLIQQKPCPQTTKQGFIENVIMSHTYYNNITKGSS